jgi:hypothetical protein
LNKKKKKKIEKKNLKKCKKKEKTEFIENFNWINQKILNILKVYTHTNFICRLFLFITFNVNFMSIRILIKKKKKKKWRRPIHSVSTYTY